MNAKKIILNLLLLVLLIGLVNAQEDFAATSLPSIELCPCSSQAYTVTVENTGTAATSYTVLASATVAEWIKFNPDKFILNPGQKGNFFVIVNSDCNIEGNYDLEIFITTTNGLTKVIKQVLKFSQCYDYSLEQGKVIDEADESIGFLQHDNGYLLCKDEQKIIPILITNNEKFENRYKLILDAPEWAALNVNNIGLNAKKSGIFLTNFDTTNVEGEFDFKLNTVSELGKVQRKKNIKVDVGDCYALELELEKEKDDVCSGEIINYDVTIKNAGTLRQNVKLELDAPDWASIENASFYLSSEQEKTVTLNANPHDDVSGSFLVEVSTVPDNKPELKFSDKIEIDAIPKLACYIADISTKTSVTNFYNHDLFFAKVKNDGRKEAIYNVSLEGPSWVSISPGTLELNPGQTGNLNLDVNPGADLEPDTYGIKINLESKGAVYSKNVDIVLKKENEFVKKVKAAVKFYQYYIYLLILLVVLAVIFINQLKGARDKIKKRHEKYKVKKEKLMALKLARKEKEKEKKKEKELEREREKQIKEKEIKKAKKRIKKLKISLNRIWIYILFIIAAIIFIGHQNRLFNAKYLPIYIRNLFVGYLYYILIGVGIAVALFLLVLLYNFISKKGKKKKVKKAVKKTEKKAKTRRKRYNIPYYQILFILLFGIVIYSISFFGLFENIKTFFVLYQYYFALGITILVAIIFLIRFYKPLFKFLRE